MLLGVVSSDLRRLHMLRFPWQGETSKFTVPETCLHTEASIDLAFSKTVAMELSIDCGTLRL